MELRAAESSRPADGEPAARAPLRFVVCGSDGAGKSTLVERLLASKSQPAGAAEQGSRGRLIVAEPHDQDTHELVSAASAADTAMIVIDALEGLLTQTRRHIRLIELLAVSAVVVVVNKMDLVEYSEARFREIERHYRELAGQIGLVAPSFVPVSALRGDNVLTRTEQMPWHDASTLIEYLEEVERERRAWPFRMPVHDVHRPGRSVRACGGTIMSGTIAPGEEVVLAPSRLLTKIDRIVAGGGEREVEADVAVAGQSVTLTLADELDLTPGEVIARAAEPPGVADQFEATLVWTGQQPMLPGRSYLMRICATTVTATIAPLKHKLRIESSEHIAATKLERGELGVCAIECSRPIAFDPYSLNRETGRFILIDRITEETVGVGSINFALRRSQNVRRQALNIDKQERAASLRQRPTVLWLTGLSGAGKSTIANLVESELHLRGHHTYMLDGDNVRHGLNADLGFTDADRVENIRRISEVAKLMVDAGLIVLVSFISPFRAERQMARSLFEPGEFVEVYVDTPLEVAERRDAKGLYEKARRGELVNFTGIDSPYEPPETPEICVNTTTHSPGDAAEEVLRLLEETGRVEPPPGR